MKYTDRYSSAIGSSNLRSNPDTTASDSDVVAAAGLAAKERPLAMALLRLNAGDNREVSSVLTQLTKLVWDKGRTLDVKPRLRASQSWDMACAVLAWHKDGRCKACGGHGFAIIRGTTVVGGVACPECKGQGRVAFDSEFTVEHASLARWLLAEIERESAHGGALARARLAPLDYQGTA